MLKEILSISGKSGLYRLLTQGRNSLIVETIGPEKRRMPIYGTDKVISLGDIAMYTETDERPLPQVLQSLYDKQEGKTVSMDFKKASKEELFGFLAGMRYVCGHNIVHYDAPHLFSGRECPWQLVDTLYLSSQSLRKLFHKFNYTRIFIRGSNFFYMVLQFFYKRFCFGRRIITP